MSVRIGFDMDGVLTDFRKAYRAVETSLFNYSAPIEESDVAASVPAEPLERQRGRRHHDAVWAAIRNTRDFWVTLEPIEEQAVSRLHTLMRDLHWEVFFFTQRPATLGDTVQRQTQRWLCDQGFEMPSVLPLSASRVAALAPLALHYYVDDNATNCVDFKSECHGRPILIVDDGDPVAISCARRLGITTAPAIGTALDILENGSVSPKSRPHLLRQLAQAVRGK